jgi:hypothetical protein
MIERIYVYIDLEAQVMRYNITYITFTAGDKDGFVIQ